VPNEAVWPSVEVNVSKGFLEAILRIGADVVEEIARVFCRQNLSWPMRRPIMAGSDALLNFRQSTK
jgi:hypothetical protein